MVVRSILVVLGPALCPIQQLQRLLILSVLLGTQSGLGAPIACGCITCWRGTGQREGGVACPGGCVSSSRFAAGRQICRLRAEQVGEYGRPQPPAPSAGGPVPHATHCGSVWAWRTVKVPLGPVRPRPGPAPYGTSLRWPGRGGWGTRVGVSRREAQRLHCFSILVAERTPGIDAGGFYKEGSRWGEAPWFGSGVGEEAPGHILFCCAFLAGRRAKFGFGGIGGARASLWPATGSVLLQSVRSPRPLICPRPAAT
ncbi:hypothetical protein TraAM80_08779 [Trypanosoma rangeli]|uniref:Uncharacterized protein n=1 Tax=Trypanosoma rangeli TaxID=5698 RepID=A0A422MZ61_TRYRA|nr:uncharacterized protein TraAM80_08779 [Trypanosoma rangeli]RNE98461.1 hypothetical protein TraAM80_08779 [Trypanosoma rangeli]|eukprot:RNE98461.1 hypothetical protein TraAM80_08779 [Trypanosoma rangeli]